MGDGSLVRMKTGRLRFQLRGHITEDRDHYENFIIPTFNKTVAIPLMRKKISTVAYKKRNCYGIATENKSVTKFLLSLGLPLGTKNDVHVPEWIKNDDENSKAFLRGLMDTDGSVFFSNSKKHTGMTFDIGLTSQRLINDVYQMLLSLEFHPYMLKPYKKKKENEKTLYKVRIKRKADLEKWINEIGFSNPKHETKTKIYKLKGYCMPNTTLNQRKEILAALLS
jgi:DNA-binding transcriptional regulator WhiA